MSTSADTTKQEEHDPWTAQIISDLTGKPPEPPKEFVKPKIIETVSEMLTAKMERDAALAANKDTEPAKAEDVPKEEVKEAAPVAKVEDPAPVQPPQPTVAVKKPAQPKPQPQAPNIDLIAETVRREIQRKSEQEASKPKPDADQEFVKTLGDDDAYDLELARHAAKHNPTKYSDIDKRFVSYLKGRDEAKKALLAKDPDRSLNHEDEEFVAWEEKNRPKIERVDQRVIERSMAVEEAERKFERKLEERLTAVDRNIKAVHEKPVIESMASNFEKGILQAVATDSDATVKSVGESILEKGIDAAAEEDPLMAGEVGNIVSASKDMCKTLLAVTRGTVEFNAGKNKDHRALAEFIDRHAKIFKQHGGELLVRSDAGNRKTFLDPAEYSQALAKDPTAADRHWTFNESDMVELIAADARFNVQQTIKGQAERIAKSGFIRKSKEEKVTTAETPPAKSEKAKATENPPAVRPSAIPGAGQKATPAQETRMFSENELTSLIPGFR